MTDKWTFYHITGIYLNDKYAHRLREFDRITSDLLGKIKPENILLITGKLFEYEPTAKTLRYMNKFFKKLEEMKIATYILDPEIEKITGIVNYSNIKKLKSGTINGVIFSVNPEPGTGSGGICITSENSKDYKGYQFVLAPDSCNNLIQRNKRDELAGAYAIADCSNKGYSVNYFYPTSGFLTLSIVKGKPVCNYKGYKELPDIEPVFVEVNGFEQEAIDFIKAKYNRIDKIVQLIAESENAFSDTTELSKWLDHKNINLDIKAGVLSLHTKRKKEQIKKFGRFKIEHLEFENMLCFQRGVIDFKQKLISLDGPNRSGKSGILDILTFVLFNKSERYDRKSFIRSGSMGAITKCAFSAENKKYLIERGISGTKDIVRFFRYEESDLEDLTSSSVTRTYEKIQKITGSYEDFTNINVALQNRTLFSDWKSSEIQSAMMKYLCLDDLEQLYDKIREEYKQLETTHKTLKSTLVPVDRELEAKIETLPDLYKRKSELSEKIAGYNYERQYIIRDIEKLKEKLKITGIKKTISIEKVTEDKKLLEKKIADLSDSIGIMKFLNIKPTTDVELNLESEFADENPVPILESLNKKIYDLIQGIKPEAKIETGIDISIDKEFSELDGINLDDNFVPVNYPVITRKFNFSKPETLAEIENLEKNIVLCDFLQEIGSCESEISLIKKRTYKIDELSNEMSSALVSLSNQIIILKNRNQQITSMTGGIKFCPTCPNCNENKKIMFTNNDTEIKRLESEQTGINKKYSGLIENERIRKRESEKEIEVLEEKIKSLKIRKSEQDKIKSRISELKNDLLYFEYETKISEQNRIKRLHEIKNRKLKYDENMLIVENNKKLKDKIAELEARKSGLLKFLSHRFKHETELLKSAKSKYENVECLVKLANLEKQLAEIPEQENIDDIKPELEKIEKEISKLEITKSGVNRNSEISDRIKKIEPELEIMKVYKKALSSTGIRNNILSNIYPRLSNVMNSILARISDTSVIFDLSKTQLKVFAKVGIDLIKVKALSGSQRFVIDIAFRLALIKICNKSPILVIDEGFGCLDQENLDTMKLIFSQLRNSLDLLLIISHVPYVTSDCSVIPVTPQIDFGMKILTSENMQLQIVNGRLRLFCAKHKKTVNEEHFNSCS